MIKTTGGQYGDRLSQGGIGRGCRMRRARGSILALVFAASVVAASEVRAQCAGFTDVPVGSFCGNVTWMKNRQITTGCTATTYCPNDPVVRLAMAAFMQRVGDVVTPRVLSVEDQGASIGTNDGATHYVCTTEVVPAVAYPRTVLARASISYTLDATMDIQFGLAESIDGGAFSLPPSSATLAGPGQHQHHFLLHQPRSLDAGRTYRYTLTVKRFSGSNNNVGAWQCELNLQVYNLVGSV
jgi:hypothetical protein